VPMPLDWVWVPLAKVMLVKISYVEKEEKKKKTIIISMFRCLRVKHIYPFPVRKSKHV